jgi:Translation initiation factor 2, beta subunit (eIF-2beta)/eIF-5 N-terminal domain
MQRAGCTAWVNIDGSADPGYRYKMPPPDVRIDKVGKSGHTILANAADIAKCLQRPPQYLAKFMGLGVGALSAYDPPQGSIDLRGAFSAQVVQELVRTFVRSWVLCGRCGLPETSVLVSPGKRHSVIFDCKACGARTAADPES